MFRYWTGCPWRDVPDRFGPWQTMWKRHARFSKDGTWQLHITTVAAVLHALVTGLLTCQAALGQSVAHPSGAVLLVGWVLALTATVATVIIVIHAPRHLNPTHDLGPDELAAGLGHGATDCPSSAHLA